MSINQNFPEIRPSLNLNFARSKTLDPRITFTRASTATYVDEDGLIKTAVADEARFDHDPVTGESLGLLIEEERTNLFKYSEPDNRSSSGIGTEGEWGWQNLDPNTDITKVEGPDGVSNSASEMNLVAGNTWDAYGRLGPTGVTVGQECTFSAWVKLGTATNFVIVPNGTSNWNNMPDGWRSFDASDGLNTTSFTKVSHTFTVPSTQLINFHIGRHESTFTTQQTAGTVTVWGCQFEMGAFATSTIITSGSTKTRVPDIASIEGTNFTDFYNQNKGTIFSDHVGSEGGFTYTIQDGTNSQRLGLAGGIDNGGPFANTPSSSSFGTAPTVVAGSGLTAFGYKANDYGAYGNGTSLTGTSPTTVPTGVKELALGFRGNYLANAFMNGYISRLAYYSERLTDSQLQTLTK